MKGPIKIIYVILFLMSPFFAAAQVGNPASDPDKVPITGLEYLLVGGGIYGASRLLKKGKSKD